ncbi:cobaltochelatase subunit CobN [Brevirhabdus pacifica]|uniref:Cobaltochelatase subunit CobN n=3 Tax=Brevirhabdus pacifica TaxID=1267768 RepID=A0A1U7DKR3_9RHOB|nr:cobaltochelatase subunit CobN [Brevirhabdus pacifica]APX90515.1 cobaltochelatase subunit CobN [Brevirhabdus pacifica]OWU78476.1 cobalamin biosynthesis protein CobN [Loktanella sp. 22II-4b]PJJ85369.1 cobaltochelatase CobN subunit [Brevirhabdus pacifica]
MHMLAATAGQASDGSEPVDPGQTPAEVLFLSAADTELAALSEARQSLDAEAPELRLCNLAWFTHPFTVDKYLDDTATRSGLVIVRFLGGAAYWRYAAEQFSARLREAGVAFAALPGDDKPDEELFALSSVSRADWESLWAYCVEGGPQNAANLLRHARHMKDPASHPAPAGATPLLRAGYYWPGAGVTDLDTLRRDWTPGAPVVALTFYRALLQGAGLQPINQTIKALLRRGLNPLPVFAASLKDPLSRATLEAIFADTPPDVVLNATSFAISSPDPAGWQEGHVATVLDAPGVPVFQVILSAASEDGWEDGEQGLGARDIAMNVSLPEVDGRIITRAVSFKGEAYFDEATQCSIAAYRARNDRIGFVADLAANWVTLARTPEPKRRVALVLANYPNRDGRLANGVGLDTPAATVGVLGAMAQAGYRVTDAPADSDALMAALMAGPTNWLTDRQQKTGGETFGFADYQIAYGRLPLEVRTRIEDRWGPPESDPFFEPGEVDCGRFRLSVLSFGNVVVGIQPARGYNVDPKDSYHSPDLVPPHHYLAFYFWLRFTFEAQAIVHMGKHGNLEWLPGKAVALSETCFPEVALGPMPHAYPFIVNDPGEGTQAKRRAQAVIVDHLTPPLTRAETYGPLRDLEVLVDEYYQAAGVDPRRIAHLRDEILSLMQATGMDRDAGVDREDDSDARLAKIDAWLCDLKEAQIRDGLHIFGTAPEGRLARDLIVALVRVARGEGAGGDASLHRALADDLGLGFDPLDCDMSAPWEGPRPDLLARLTDDGWRSHGDTVERLELLAHALVEGSEPAPGPASRAVMDQIAARVRPAVEGSGPAEMAGLLTVLEGRFLPPGPSGAPTRGRLDVLPTGRNFFSVDSRALPTRAAWTLGWKSANLLLERHLQDNGDWPRTMALTAWGTANMRTGGDDIAQALALMGVRPTWDANSGRVTGFEILPESVLGRPRVDVTLRVSGFFRDAFPAQIDLVASAARAVMRLEETQAQNPAAARFRAEAPELGEDRAAFRVFGSKPGAYGAGLQAMIDERLWADRGDLADAYLEWGGYAYGEGAEGTPARPVLERRLERVEAVVQNQDNREHDLLDSDDYYQFEGGMAAAVETLSGRAPRVYHNDHSRPERPVIRTLDEEIARVMRSRAANPKWIEGVKRHGYKGAFEIAATVDYLFAFAATTHAVASHHFDLVYDAYLEDDDTRAFIAEHNAPALAEIADRLAEAIERGMWQPRSNAARGRLARLQSAARHPTERSPR